MGDGTLGNTHHDPVTFFRLDKQLNLFNRIVTLETDAVAATTTNRIEQHHAFPRDFHIIAITRQRQVRQAHIFIEGAKLIALVLKL